MCAAFVFLILHQIIPTASPGFTDDFTAELTSILTHAAKMSDSEQADRYVKQKLAALAGSEEQAVAQILLQLDSKDRKEITLGCRALNHLGRSSLRAVPKLIELQEAGFAVSRFENPLLRGIASRIKKLDSAPKELIQYLRHENPKLSRWTYNVLAALGERSHNLVPQFTKILSDPETTSQQKVFASHLIAYTGTKGLAAVPELIKQMQTKSTPIETVSTMLALGPSAIPAVAKLIPHKDHFVEVRALDLLGLHRQASSHLISKIKTFVDDEAASVQLAAARACWRIEGDAELAIPVLQQTLDIPELQTQTCDLIFELGKTARPLLSTILDALEDKTMPVSCKETLIDSVGQIGPSAMRATSVLADLCSSESVAIRHLAALSLWKVSQNPELPVATLVKILDSDRMTVQNRYRAYALKHLAQIGPPAEQAIDAIERCFLRKENSHYSAKALALIGGRGHLVLQQALSSDDSRIRRRAQWANEQFLGGRLKQNQ